MYARQVDGRTLTFGVSGKLVRNSLVMFDRQTQSLWSHLTGDAIEGPLRGKQLQLVPYTQTSWALWRKVHPDTRLLRVGSGDLADPYAGYYSGSQTGIRDRKHGDDRLPAKEKVIGVRLGGAVKAYAFSALARDGVVNDELGGVPVVIVFDGRSTSGAVYRRDPGGRVLSFQAGKASLALTDLETSSAWDGLTGSARSGPLAGTVLEQVPITYSFWFGWADFYPQTEVYR